MPYCPECNVEYKENVTTCSKCNDDLLPDIVPAQGQGTVDWYVVHSVPNEVSGYILKSVLEDEGIEVFLRSNEIPAYGGLKGTLVKSEWGELLVPTYSIQRAMECIKQYLDSLDDD